MQHKWHKEIKAWADGAEIEKTWTGFQSWTITETPEWQDSTLTFRIKPQPKEPQYLYVFDNGFDKNFTTNKCGAVIKTDNQKSAYKYIGKIKLEVDDGNN